MKRRTLIVLAFLLGAIATPSSALMAQEEDMIWPPEIYTGDNVVTVRLRNGIRSLRFSHTPHVRVEGGTGDLGCVGEYELRVVVNSVNVQQSLTVTAVDCNGRRFQQTLSLSNTWNVDVNSYGRVEAEDTACHEFQIRLESDGFGGLGTGTSHTVDSITSPDPHVIIKLPRRLPAKVTAGSTFRYQVCFAADKPGTYKFPVVTWMRRRYFSGGMTTYPVADTGLAIVIPKRVAEIPPPPRDTARPPERYIPPDTAYVPPTPIPEPPISDPTTFRSVAVPNAIIPEAGRGFVGVYDLLGLTAGYALSDNLMLIAGGALPTPDDWGGIKGEMFGAYSLGLKGGFPLADDLDVAAGLQWGRSFYDQQSTPDDVESLIDVYAPYVAFSYGDDDSRLSATLGYAFKHHTKPSVEFDQNAMLAAFGGDYRIGRNWKIAGELITMETLGVIPIIATLRYFSSSFALDAGIGYVGITTGDTKPPAIPLVPVVSAVMVF